MFNPLNLESAIEVHSKIGAFEIPLSVPRWKDLNVKPCVKLIIDASVKPSKVKKFRVKA